MPDDTPPAAVLPAPTGRRRLFALLRVLAVIAAGFAAWYVAGNWNRWAGDARYETTDDAAMAGDVTPLAARVSGYVEAVPVTDYQAVRTGDLLVQIEGSDYRARLARAEANLAAAQAMLDNLGNQKDVQRALIRQAEATIQATTADANAQRTAAQLMLNTARLDQQKALLAGLDIQARQVTAQLRAAEAAVVLARNDIDDMRITSPADGMVGQRQVRPGQFVTVGTPVITVVALPDIWVIANYKETQMTHMRIGQSARIAVDAFPALKLTGRVDSWSPATARAFAPPPSDNATGTFTKVVQRVPVKIVLDANPAIGTLVRPGMSVEATIDTTSTAPGPPQKAFASLSSSSAKADDPRLPMLASTERRGWSAFADHDVP